MTNKEKYIDDLRSQYPDEPEEFLELCWLLHDYGKARDYADLLSACTSYADIAQKVVRPMYVSGDIDDIRARSEKFLTLLIPLVCLDISGNSHAAVYHIRQMLDDPDVRRDRRSLEEQRSIAWRARQESQVAQTFAPSCKVTIEINDAESMRMFIDFLQSAGVSVSVEKEQIAQCTAPVTVSMEYLVIEDTPQWLHEVLVDLYTYYPDADLLTYSFQSDGMTHHDITLTETLGLISQELS